jgi:hypothetical protein
MLLQSRIPSVLVLASSRANTVAILCHNPADTEFSVALSILGETVLRFALHILLQPRWQSCISI